MVAKFVSEFTSKYANMSKNTISKTALNEKNSKEPNVGIFSDTSGRVSKILHLDWSRIYLIFGNDNFSTITHDQQAFVNINKSQLHCIAARRFMPCTDPVKWELDHASPKERSFDDHAHT